MWFIGGIACAVPRRFRCTRWSGTRRKARWIPGFSKSRNTGTSAAGESAASIRPTRIRSKAGGLRGNLSLDLEAHCPLSNRVGESRGVRNGIVGMTAKIRDTDGKRQTSRQAAAFPISYRETMMLRRLHPPDISYRVDDRSRDKS